MKTKALLKVEYRVTVDYHLSRPPPSRYTEISTKYSFLYCASQETRNPNFLRRWAFLPTFACVFIARSEEDLEKVTVRSEFSTWRVVLAVTFGTL